MRGGAAISGLAAIALVTVGGGCAGRPPVTAAELGDLRWPVAQPRVRLAAVVERDRGRGGRLRTWLDRLAGRDAEAAAARPFGVAWDGDDLLVADPDGGRVLRIAADHRIALSPVDAVSHPIGIARCPRGIVVSDSRSGAVALLNSALKRTGWLLEGLDRPTGVGCQGDRVLVLETGQHRLWIVAADGSTTTLGSRGRGPGQFNFPTALAVDGAAAWVGDTLNFRIQRIDLGSGRFVDQFGTLGDAPGELPRLKGIALDRDGHLWVTDAVLDRVSLYRRDGTLLLTLGGRGARPGELSFPAGVAAHPDGRVAVVDSFNRRLQVFQLVR